MANENTILNLPFAPALSGSDLDAFLAEYQKALLEYNRAAPWEKAMAQQNLIKLQAQAKELYGLQPEQLQNFSINGTTDGSINPSAVRDYTDSLTAGQNIADAQLKQKEFNLQKAAFGAGIANQALDVVLGAAQMASAHKTLKNLQAPKYPTVNVNQQPLQDRIYQAQKLASGINPILERQQQEAAAEANAAAKGYAIGASGGNAGTFGALMTMAHANQLKNARANELQNQQVAMAYQNNLDNLIASKMADDWKRWEAMKGQFNDYDYPEYKRMREGAEKTSQTGLSNILQGASNMPNWLGSMSSYAPSWAQNNEVLHG